MDETEKLAQALEKIVSKYEGDPDDPTWAEAKQALANLKPKPMFLYCPQCKYLHVDEGALAAKAHRVHECLKCSHKWKPFAYPTFGIAVDGMDTDESMAFLDFFAKWLTKARRYNPRISPQQVGEIQRIAASFWRGSRDHWLVRQDTGKSKKGRARKMAPEPQAVDDDHDLSEEIDPNVLQAVKEGKLDKAAIEDLGLNPVLYGFSPHDDDDAINFFGIDEQDDVTPEEAGISFEEEPGPGHVDEETGIEF